MVLTSTSIPTAARTGVRQIDLRTDLRAMADLIQEAFGAELDASGRASLREMHTLSHLGPLLYLLIPPSGEMGSFFRGFIYESEGQVVGNITIQQLDDPGLRWMIANVAVRRDHQGQGIARQLMAAALDRIREMGGEWAVLQVRQDNAVARGLYQRMGFSDVVAETQMRIFVPPTSLRRPGAPLPPGCVLRPVVHSDAEAVQYLLRRAMPELARWWRSHRVAGFTHSTDGALAQVWGRLTGQGFRQRLGLWRANELAGLADADVRPLGEHRIDLLLHPDFQGQAEPQLAAAALAHFHAYPRRPITATLYDYQPEAIAALVETGFHATTTLITMRKRITRRSETLSMGTPV